jgi:hypothetical protein
MNRSSGFACLGIAVLILSAASGARAATVIASSNVTANANNATRVEEPVIVVVTAADGDNYAVTAYNRFDPVANKVNIGTVSENLSNGSRVAATPANPYANGQTSDPVLVIAGNRVYLIAVAFGGGANQITEWFSDDGGRTWSRPFTIHENGAGSGQFDDKPAAILSQNIHEPPELGGGYVLHLAYVRTGAQAACEAKMTNLPVGTIHFLSSTNWRDRNTGNFACFDESGALYDSDTSPSAPQGWCEKSTVASGPGLENPVLFDVPYYTLHAGYQDFCNSAITIATSGDHGTSWHEQQSIFDGYMLPNGSFVCDGSDQCVSASLGMTGHYNSGTGRFGLAWHRRKPGTSGGAEVLFTTYRPYGSAFWSRFDGIQSVSGSHYGWTPAVEVGSNGNFLVTYYDWDFAASPSLQYRLFSTKFDGTGNPVAGEVSQQLFDTAASNPAVYGSRMRVGEYQGLFFWNGNFHAATVYVKNGIGDIYHLTISAP